MPSEHTFAAHVGLAYAETVAHAYARQIGGSGVADSGSDILRRGRPGVSRACRPAYASVHTSAWGRARNPLAVGRGGAQCRAGGHVVFAGATAGWIWLGGVG